MSRIRTVQTMTATIAALQATYHALAGEYELAADAEARARNAWHDALAATSVPTGDDEVEYWATVAYATVAYDTYNRLAGARDRCLANLSASRDALTRARPGRSLPATPPGARPAKTVPLPAQT